MPERPERMFRRGRPIVPFCSDGAEPLYRRFASQAMLQDGWEGLSFKFPECSVNRGGVPGGPDFGDPEDVIWGLPDSGILKILVGDIPEFVRAGDGAQWFIGVEHTPNEQTDEENYAHCDIKLYKRASLAAPLEHQDGKDLPKVAKKEWRQVVTNRVQARPDGIYKLPSNTPQN